MIQLIASLAIAAGPGWADGDLQAGLTASAGQKPVLVYVHAHWCSPCNQLGTEVIDTPLGEQLLRRAVGIRVDFDTPAGRVVTERYAVINLPTTLVLSPAGDELGRVEGYPGRDEYVKAIEDAMGGKRGLEVLEAELQQNPGDLDLMVTVAQARLVRGQDAAANALLVRAMDAGGSVGARAVRIWGRWLLRVKRDGVRGTEHFLTWMKRYEGKEDAQGFLYWAARGYVLQGKRDDALALFDAWIARDPRGYDAAEYKADFMVNNGYDAARSMIAVKGAMALDPSNAWPYYLQAELALRAGDRDTAMRAIDRALRLKPGKAIFVNFARRRLGVDPARLGTR